jgi:hypothetical protein
MASIPLSECGKLAGDRNREPTPGEAGLVQCGGFYPLARALAARICLRIERSITDNRQLQLRIASPDRQPIVVRKPLPGQDLRIDFQPRVELEKATCDRLTGSGVRLKSSVLPELRG